MPSDKFFIAGMPRCRTAWFSAYFSAYDGVFCYHEALNGLKSRQAFYDLMEQPGVIGDADSGLYITDFQERWPEAPTVVVLRDPAECQASIAMQIGIEPELEPLERQYEEAKALKGFHVEHGQINENLVAIHEYLGISFDERIANHFENLNVQLHQPWVDMDSYRLWGALEVA